MTTSNAANLKLVGKPFAGKREIVQMRFDVAAGDGLALNTYNLFKALDAMVITAIHAVVKTTCTSLGSATVSAGITGSITKFFGNTTGAVANLTADAFIPCDVVEGAPNVLAIPCKIAAGDYVVAAVGTAALTAGVIEFTVEVMHL